MPSFECRGKKKLWSVRFNIINDHKETTKRLSGFKTKKECQQAYIQFLNEYNKNKIDQDKVSFSALYNEYKNFIKSRNKPSTYYDYISKTTIHILPYFEQFSDVSKITPKIILDWQNMLEEKNFSYNYKSCLRTYLSGILNYADKYYNIPNQLKRVDTFKNNSFKKEMKIWTPQEFEKVMNFVNDDIYKTFYYALFYTGARKGEILATTEQDWNFEKETVRINKTVSRKVVDALFLVTSPKNQSSNRTIKVPKNVLIMVKNLINTKKENNVPGDFVFYGSCPLPESSISRKLSYASKLAQIDCIRIHDFRHSHASFLISNGASIVSVSKRLGHSSIEQTLNTYTHLMPNDEETLQTILDKI